MKITEDDLRSPIVVEFLREHLSDMHATSPPESTHALDAADLRQPDVYFWTGWDHDRLMACGALKRLSDSEAEIKSMRTTETARGRGIASKMLEHLLAQASQLGFRRVSLETGSMAFFAPARNLYLKHGFEYCPPFADYREDPNSVFMTRLV